MYIHPGCSSNLATWMDDRRPTPPILLFKGHAALSNTARPRMNSNARKMTRKEDIHLHGVQNFFFFELTPPPEGMSNTVMPLLGGRRKVPPAPRCLLRRRRSPCSNFGGRLACNELIIAEYCSAQYLGLLCHVRRFLTMIQKHLISAYIGCRCTDNLDDSIHET